MNGEADEALTATLSIGEVRTVGLASGECVLIVGSEPSGFPVILSREDWTMLQRWKLNRLRIVGGHVRACGGSSKPLAARFLTNTVRGGNFVIRYRNGNALDLRRSNIAVVPCGVIRGAKRIESVPPERSKTVTLRDGRARMRRKPKRPNSAERLAALLERAPGLNHH